MGRKIPSSKKHKKTKSVDPFYDGHRKKLLEKSVGVSNRPPANADIQEFPRKLKELMNLTKQVNTRKCKVAASTYKKHKKQRLMNLEVEKDDFGSMQPGMNNPLKAVPEMKKRPGESDKMFIQRVSRIAKGIVEQSQLEGKLDVNITEKPSGEVEIQKRTKLDFDEDGNKLEEENKNKQNKISDKKERRRIKEKEKKEQLKEDHLLDEFETPKDIVRFGEVASEPPNLQFKSMKKDKPKSLILTKMFTTTSDGNTESHTTQSRKRKLANSIEKLKLEKEREFVIAEYRKLKKSNINKI